MATKKVATKKATVKKATAKKTTAKKVTATPELKETLAKVQDTAKSVNAQIMETATEVFEDVKDNGTKWTNEMVENGKQWAKSMTAQAQAQIEKIDIENGLNAVKGTAKKVNEYSLEAASTIVETTIENTKEWQTVAEKAIKGGLKMADKNQDIAFDTLEAVKEQAVKSVKRFKALFSNN